MYGNKKKMSLDQAACLKGDTKEIRDGKTEGRVGERDREEKRACFRGLCCRRHMNEMNNKLQCNQGPAEFRHEQDGALSEIVKNKVRFYS
jgi:hypothetical protein